VISEHSHLNIDEIRSHLIVRIAYPQLMPGKTDKNTLIEENSEPLQSLDIANKVRLKSFTPRG
jgi:hypothetical protein